MRREFMPMATNLEAIRTRLTALENQPATLADNNQTVDSVHTQLGQAQLYGFYSWSDGKNDHLVPESFQIDTSITLLSLWIQWHHGIPQWNDKNNRSYQIRPLKYLKSYKDYPGSRRLFFRVLKICRLLDRVTGISTNVNTTPPVHILNERFNTQAVREQVLPQEVVTARNNRRRTRTRTGELTWRTIEAELELRLKTPRRNLNNIEQQQV